MAYDECILKGERGRCASWPILDPATQVHPGLHLGGGGNGVCISHAKSLLRDVRTGNLDVYDPQGNPTDIEGKRLDTGETDPDWRRQIERVHDVYEKATGERYLGMRSRRRVQTSEPQVERKRKSAMSEAPPCPWSFTETFMPRNEGGDQTTCGNCGSSVLVKPYPNRDGMIPGHRIDGTPWDGTRSASLLSDHTAGLGAAMDVRIPGDSEVRRIFGLEQ